MGGAARLVVGVLLVGLVAVWLWSNDADDVVLSVPGDYPTVAAALSAAPDGAVVRISSGVYRESVVILRPVTLHGEYGAHLIGPGDLAVITIEDASGVTVRGLRISGGQMGVLVLASETVSIEDNEIVDNELRGVKVVGSSVVVRANRVAGTWSVYGIGIHVANAISRPPSIVAANVVEDNGAEGIVVNLAHITIEDNVVRGNGSRGISVIEMSVGSVFGNRVEANAGAGILVLDMSTAMLRDNEVVGTIGGPLGRADPIRIEFHSVAELVGNVMGAEGSCPVTVASGSLVTGSANHWEGTGVTCAGVPDGFFGES